MVGATVRMRSRSWASTCTPTCESRPPVLFSRYFGARLCQQALNALLQTAWRRTDHTPNQPSTREQHERRDALDAQLGRHQHVLIGIHLRETQPFLIGLA